MAIASDDATRIDEQRFAALARYDILDTPRESDFDDIAEMAAEICGTPIAVVNLIANGRQWFKAEVGLGVREIPLDVSFCAHALLEQDFMLVPDATQDERFDCNPLVTAERGLRFYAGALLKTPEGTPIGTVCVLDYQPRALDQRQIANLQRLARQVMTQLELRRALAHRRISEARYRNMADHAPVMMWVTEPDGRCVYLSRLWYDYTGQSEAEALGIGWFGGAHPDDRDDAVAAFRRANTAVAPFRAEYRLRRADGVYRWVLDVATPRIGTDGRFLGYIGSVIDIDDRHDAEDALRASEAHLRLLLDSTSEGFYSVDCEGHTTLCNNAFLAMLGFARREDVIGRKLHDVIHHTHPDGSHYNVGDCPIYQGASSGREAHVTNEYFYRLDGTAFPVEYWVHPILVEGALTGAICTFIDVTERRRSEEALHDLNATLEQRVADAVAEREVTEEQLRQSQKIEAIGQLTGGVAHDFNNLLTVIRGSVDLLRRPGLSEERRARYFEAISDTADRAAKLTSQLLAFARRSALTPTVFDVGASISALREMMGTLTGSMVRLEIEVAEDACFINADPSQFDTAIVNMAVNARDAMDRQGDLKIAVRAVTQIPAIRTHRAVAGDYVAVSLTDTGIGIASDRIDHIFEPFFTTKGVGEGTGLGLSQVFGFAKQSGGEIVVDSHVGAGTTFTLFLPRVAAPGEMAEIVTRERYAGAQGGCILVVEDNPEVGEFAAQALAELGYSTILATDGEQALDRLASGATRFDAVFSDVVMPGMSGIELGQEIRRLYPDLPMLVTSGYSSILAHEGTHGFDLLHKPYSVEELSHALRRVVSAKIIS